MKNEKKSTKGKGRQKTPRHVEYEEFVSGYQPMVPIDRRELGDILDEHVIRTQGR